MSPVRRDINMADVNRLLQRYVPFIPTVLKDPKMG